MAALLLGFVVLRVTHSGPGAKYAGGEPGPLAAPSAAAGPVARPAPPLPVDTPALSAAICSDGPAAAAQANAASLQTLAWSPFGRTETGWATYAPLIGREINTACAPDTPGFALALAQWEAARGLAADGVFSAAVFTPLRNAIELRRPFVQVSAKDVCPDPPAAGALASDTPAEGYAGKVVELRAGALTAYRRMVAAARREDAAIAADARNLTLFSGFRSPAADDARCAQENNCDNRVRTTCSAHRTGLAIDLYVGQAPGFGPDSSADANRAAMSRTAAYRWLVANADRFGFVPYPFEPWHWEWTGEAP
ncbi:MAG: D-alanyl-D-alanine carboxypeptidase family protein [Phenylobacterium sp.]